MFWPKVVIILYIYIYIYILVATMQNCDVVLCFKSSTITFTFGQIHFGKL